MLGLCQHHTNVTKLVSIGIGPDKVEWTTERLQALGVDTTNLPFEWSHKISLHTSKYAEYGDRMPESFGGIDFHPTYEGKMIRWLREREALRPDEGLGFWIVGSEAQLEVVRPFYTHEVRHED
jgi:hypothetical protein